MSSKYAIASDATETRQARSSTSAPLGRSLRLISRSSSVSPIPAATTRKVSHRCCINDQMVMVHFEAGSNHFKWHWEGEERQSLPNGSCSLYRFPLIHVATRADVPEEEQPEETQAGKAPGPDGTNVLHEMVLLMATEESSAFDVHDPVGAYPIHALCVGNNDASLDLLFALVSADPKMVTRLHASCGPYEGESCLHILAVNGRESHLVKLLNLAASKLPRNEFNALLREQARGKFFDAAPMRRYGSTALSYACSFGMRAAISTMLATGLVSLNDTEDRCTASGFMPLHAVVASNNLAMFDHLTSELPFRQRSKRRELTTIGRLERHGRVRRQAGLTPLQLAAQLGHHSMVRHILRKQCDVLWVWGPVTNHSLDLSSVDSCGAGDGDVMDLIVRVDASLRTTELLLDNFMHGFIYKLYLLKWHLYGRRLHYTRLALDGTLFVSHAIQSFWFKLSPSVAYSSSLSVAQNWLHVVLIVGRVVLELYTLMLYARNERSQLEEPLSRSSSAYQAWRFFSQHGVHILFASYAFILIGCMLLAIPGALPHPDCAPDPVTGWFKVWLNEQSLETNTTRTCVGQAGRRLRASGSSGGGSGGGAGGGASGTIWSSSDIEAYDLWEITDEGRWALLWMSQAAALGLLVLHLGEQCAAQFYNLKVTLTILRKMLMRDFAQYISAFGLIFFAFYLALFILYPRSGAHLLPQSVPFNSAYRTFFALLDMAFLAEKAEIDVLPPGFQALGSEQQAAFIVWLMLYYSYLVVSCILMLNFLIAQMAYTIEEVLAAATLQSRLGFATHVMKLELLAQSLKMRTRVGQLTDGKKYVFTFKSYATGANDGDDEEGSAAMLDVLDLEHSDLGIGDPFESAAISTQGDTAEELRKIHRTLQRLTGGAREEDNEITSVADLEDAPLAK